MGNQGDLDTRHQHKAMVSSNGTFVNRLLKSKEHRNDLAGSRLKFSIKLANVKESFVEYPRSTGVLQEASHCVAIRHNTGCVEEVTNAIMAIWRYIGSTYQEPHELCPIGEHSWYEYQSDMAKGSKGT